MKLIKRFIAGIVCATIILAYLILVITVTLHSGSRPFQYTENNQSMELRVNTQEQLNYRSPQELKYRYERECVDDNLLREVDDVRDKFVDLFQIYVHEISQLPLSELLNKKSNIDRITLQEIHEIPDRDNFTLLEQFYLGISDQELYKEEDVLIPKLLREMSESRIVQVEEKPGGTQLKLIVTYFDNSRALMKPMRFDRNRETNPDHFYFNDFERHNSEIAAFHLDRILGFRRCPPVAGRKLNISTEIYAVADTKFLKTAFVSPAQNLCFFGHCRYYCDSNHAICGHPDDIEGSFAAFLPPDHLSGRKIWKNPWKRSYNRRKKAIWETNNDYCDQVRLEPLYKNTKRLAQIIDMSILDFLMGNMDRHNYETFKVFGQESLIIHYDHGRGFGKSKHDEISILAPLYQCCFIDFFTFERLLKLQRSPIRLSTSMRCSLYNDTLNSILNDAHLDALDRRLQIILNIIRKCFRDKNSKEIFYFGGR